MEMVQVKLYMVGPRRVSKLASEKGYVYTTSQNTTYARSFLRHPIEQKKTTLPQMCVDPQPNITYNDGACVPRVRLGAQTLPSPAVARVRRGRWGLSRCRIRRDGRTAACQGRNRDTKRAAICGMIRCVGSVHSFGLKEWTRDSPLDHDFAKILGNRADAASTVAAGVALSAGGWR